MWDSDPKELSVVVNVWDFVTSDSQTFTIPPLPHFVDSQTFTIWFLNLCKNPRFAQRELPNVHDSATSPFCRLPNVHDFKTRSSTVWDLSPERSSSSTTFWDPGLAPTIFSNPLTNIHESLGP